MGVQGWFIAIPLLGLIALVAGSVFLVRAMGEFSLRDRMATICAGIPFACLLLFVGVWFAMGRVQCWPVFLAGVTLVFTLLGLLAVVRARFFIALPTLGGHSSNGVSLEPHLHLALTVPRDILLLVAAAVYSYVALDALWNDMFFSVSSGFALIGIVALLVIYLLLYFLGQRTGVAVSLGVVFFTVIGIVQYFVVLYKGSPILPSDIYAIGTAVAVSGGYDLVFTKDVLWLLVACAIIIFLMGFMGSDTRGRQRKSGALVVANCVCALVVGGSAFAYFNTVDLADAFGADKAIWQPLESYKAQSFMPSSNTPRRTIRRGPLLPPRLRPNLRRRGRPSSPS